MLRNIIVGLVTVTLTGCAADMALVPLEGQSKKNVYIEGNPAVIGYNSDQTIGVVVNPQNLNLKSDQRLRFYVLVMNLGEEDFLFDPSSTKAETSSGISLKVYSYQEIVDEIETQRNWAAVANAINAGSRSYRAGQAGTTYHSGNAYTTGSYNAFGSDENYLGNYSGSTTYYGTSYNAGEAQRAREQARAQNQADMQRTQQAYEINMAAASSVLKKSTVFPNANIAGFIVVEQPENEQQIKLTTFVNGEPVDFDFSYMKRK